MGRGVTWGWDGGVVGDCGGDCMGVSVTVTLLRGVE